VKNQQRRAAKVKRRKERKQVRHRTIHTGGRTIAGLPFMGEMMTCCMCGKVQQSDPKVSNNWRAVEPDGVRHYVCPDHFPPDATGTPEQFRQAYIAVFKKLLEGSAALPAAIPLPRRVQPGARNWIG
jgi:hypothetical protein